ncbi:signal recognition particle subunit SRP19 [Natronobacterium gregoryi]|uniref:Signal recognition particle 19 kDa protein n=2 Tax=Natronobacterium gregoryi TaxID=44930 RepID=L0AM97_NATGS|nr:signal recognition particle subunit SRP19 [Natronobacterium gregoryi]AFZ74916.1 signal recognition particle 19 kDa protein [Natronobacterium gregoryi SP2]ELY67394.1 Signal recognition particle 19 kDa protein [Natronobacterium gregoryi SP2]PLK19844.1 signal recognition particle protein Srp19 [Natronobacterium gregoryi SP2]SFJ39074.1 signal recognition particle, subunit SRP19 (srp19) [Natronobacterium gregoryi]
MVENVIWPAYLDASLSRSEGRRVSSDLAVEEPTVDEIAKAVQQIGYDATIERDKSYSREHWAQRGRVVVRGADDSTKNDLVQAVAAYVVAMRE